MGKEPENLSGCIMEVCKMSKKTIVVVGAGPGLGNHLAKEFGRNGFRAILIARSEKKLQEYVSEMKNSGIEADYQVADCASNESIRAAFDAVKKKHGFVDVMAYNTAVLRDGFASSISPEELTIRYQVDVAGAVCAAQQVLPEQMLRGEGAILFTGGGLALNPVSQFASISIHKAALRVLAIALHDEVKDKGVYVGIVNIKGNIGSDDYYDPARIAEQFYQMYSEKRVKEITY